MNTKAIFTFVVGMVSLFFLFYFYLAQRDFESNYKETRDIFYAIDKSHYSLNNEILKSSLYAYSNHDKITNELRDLKKHYLTLKNHKTWKKKHYISVYKEISAFNATLQSYESAVFDFMMLNSGVRNSFVFITSLTNNSLKAMQSEPELYLKLMPIISDITKTRLLSDLTFMQDLNIKITQLRAYRDKNQNQLELIDSFLLHASFLEKNFPALIEALNSIESLEFDKKLEMIEKRYIKASKQDYVMLDKFVFVMVALLVIAMMMIIALLIRTDRENRRLRELKDSLRHALSHDQLTNLYSRRRYEVMLREFENPTLILLNIDRFKHINDFYGTDVGNIILQELALLIRQPNLNAYHPSFFRLGGDDFGIVLQDISMQRAELLAKDLKRKIEAHLFDVDGIGINITAAIAINNVLPLFENADLALMHEKDAHSGSIILFSESMGLKEHSKNNLKVMSEVKLALEQDAIAPWFQPIVSLFDTQIIKYEALVRLKRQDGSISTPNNFLPIIMQTSYYHQITIIVLQKTLAQMVYSNLRFSINISMRDLADKKLVESFLEQLEIHKEQAKRLDIELLESEELSDLDLIREFIIEVKKYGCHIAIDDFGSGYSNFSYIIDLPIDTLKIDGSLISKMMVDRNKYIAVKSIVSFAASLGLEIIAEYVEDLQTAEALDDLGVHHAQGYYFGKPKPDTILE